MVLIKLSYQHILFMQREVKQNWDYKALHTSGQRVIKPVKMTDRFKQNELNCIDDLDAYMEDNNVQDIDDCNEAKRDS